MYISAFMFCSLRQQVRVFITHDSFKKVTKKRKGKKKREMNVFAGGYLVGLVIEMLVVPHRSPTS